MCSISLQLLFENLQYITCGVGVNKCDYSYVVVNLLFWLYCLSVLLTDLSCYPTVILSLKPFACMFMFVNGFIIFLPCIPLA